MRLRVLGTGAFGGIPYWNDGKEASRRARAELLDPASSAAGARALRTTACLAVSADGERFTLIDAGSDLPFQLARTPSLHPQPGSRAVPIDGLILTGAHLEQSLGLLALRSAISFRIHSSEWVRAAHLEHDAAFRSLEALWSVMPLDRALPLDRDGALEARLFPTKGSVPDHLIDHAKPRAGMNVGVRIVDRRTGRRLVYAPRIGELDSGTLAELRAADLRIVDGTFAREDEPVRARPGAPLSTEQGHVPLFGPKGSLEWLSSMPGRTLLTHVAPSNPLAEGDAETLRRIELWNVELAHDGMEIEL